MIDSRQALKWISNPLYMLKQHMKKSQTNFHSHRANARQKRETAIHSSAKLKRVAKSTGRAIKFESDRRKIWSTRRTRRFHSPRRYLDPLFLFTRLARTNFAIVQQALSMNSLARGYRRTRLQRRCILFPLCFCWKLLSPPGAKVVSWMSRWLNTTRWCALSETNDTRHSPSHRPRRPPLSWIYKYFQNASNPIFADGPRNTRPWIIYQPKHYC